MLCADISVDNLCSTMERNVTCSFGELTVFSPQSVHRGPGFSSADVAAGHGTNWDGVRRRNVCFTSLGGMGPPAYDSDFQSLPFLTSDFIWGTGSKQSVVQLSKWKNVCGDKVLDHYPNVKGESVKPSLQKLLNIATDMGPSFDSCTPSEWAIKTDVQKAWKKIGWKAEHIVEVIEADDL
eukprot:g46235.t1